MTTSDCLTLLACKHIGCCLNCRFDQLIEYGQKMVASNPRVKQLRDRVTALKQEKVALKDTWSERNDVLHEGQDLQVSY